ncbi:MAG TPA: hypothetical protein VM682_01295 [Bacillus sp. (in: firmicutes)]|nr:hypothetical protein [Bacillus sp. (in: firmicutes)]
MIGTKVEIIRQIKERSKDTLIGLLAIGFVKEFYIIEVTKWGCSYEK